MVSIWHLVKVITVWIRHHEKIGLVVGLGTVEGKGYYQRSRLKGENEIIPPFDTREINVRPMSGVGPMRIQEGTKDMTGGYQHQGSPFEQGVLTLVNLLQILLCSFLEVARYFIFVRRRLRNFLTRLDRVLFLSDFSPSFSDRLHLFVLWA